MLYKSTKDLPQKIQDTLPEKAQLIYKDAFNETFQAASIDKEEARIETAAKIAWEAVTKYYTKKDNEWVEINAEESKMVKAKSAAKKTVKKAVKKAVKKTIKKTPKKAATKKSTAKKSAPKKRTTKKTVAKKAAPKKRTAKKIASKKSTAKVKRAAPKKR